MARKEGGKHMRTGLTRKTKEGDKKGKDGNSHRRKRKRGREKQRGTSKKSDITGWGDTDEYT